MAEPAPQMVSAVADAYFAKELGAPAAARERAQRSFTIAGAIITTLVAAGVFTNIASTSTAARGAGIATVAAWVVAASLFTWTVASPINRIEQDKTSNADEFVRAALDVAKSEREEVDRRLRLAHIAALTATLATILTLTLVLFAPPNSSAASLLLSRQAVTAVDASCPGAVIGNRLPGSLEISSLNDDFVTITPSSGPCARTRLRLPRADVSAESG